MKLESEGIQGRLPHLGVLSLPLLQLLLCSLPHTYQLNRHTMKISAYSQSMHACKVYVHMHMGRSNSCVGSARSRFTCTCSLRARPGLQDAHLCLDKVTLLKGLEIWPES